MYTVEKVKIKAESSEKELYAVADESGIICDFTSNFSVAEKLVRALNKNNVERCHVMDVIEDIFYS